MAQLQLPALLDRLRDLVGPAARDDELLRRFVRDRDDSAFARLVKRHGPMVLSVCRGVLRHHQEAEDAFQATFLVLAQSARTIQNQSSVGAWLHGVAYRVSLKRLGQRRVPIAIEFDELPGREGEDASLSELRGIVHEELHRLPVYLAQPLLLSYFEGLTRDEGARRLGITPGVFKKRIEQARDSLGKRLVRRGVVPALAFSGTALTRVTAAAATVSAKSLTFTAASASPAAVSLAKGLVKTMWLAQWIQRAAAVMAIVGLSLGGVIAISHALAGGQAPPAAEKPTKEAADSKADDKQRFVGEWRIAKIVEGGNPVAPNEDMGVIRITFKNDGKATFFDGVDKREGAYSLSGPGLLDWSVLNEKTISAIYRFDDDGSLTIAFRTDNEGTKRPTSFSLEGQGAMVRLHLERVATAAVKKSDLEVLRGTETLAARRASMNSLKHLLLALHAHADRAKGIFPAHAIYSADRKAPLLSWRVAILPYLDQKELYDQFKLDEPWDSKHNKTLIAKMPKIFEAPVGEKAPGKTYYQAFTGPTAAFHGPKGRKFTDFTDGLSNTFLLAEGKTPVTWTQPVDIVVPAEADKMPEVGGLFKDGTNVGVADGAVLFISRTMSPAQFQALLTPAGNDNVLKSAKQITLRFEVLQGDPRGSRDANTIRVLAEPTLVFLQNDNASFIAGGEVPGLKKSHPFGVQLEIQAGEVADARIPIDMVISISHRDVRPDGRTVIQRTGGDIIATVPLGQKQTTVLGGAGVNQTWVEYTFEEVKEK